jgi:hypothetical protein
MARSRRRGRSGGSSSSLWRHSVTKPFPRPPALPRRAPSSAASGTPALLEGLTAIHGEWRPHRDSRKGPLHEHQLASDLKPQSRRLPIPGDDRDKQGETPLSEHRRSNGTVTCWANDEEVGALRRWPTCATQSRVTWSRRPGNGRSPARIVANRRLERDRAHRGDFCIDPPHRVSHVTASRSRASRCGR